MLNLQRLSIFSAILALYALTGCRGDDELLVPSTEQPTLAAGSSFYLLNEGNMGSNKATLDFYDGTLGIYRHNIFPEQNPTVSLELGDVGNDLAVYGTRLYALLNVSGLVEVMDARTARHIGTISIPNCRYICFHEGKAYVTSYAGPVQPNDPTSRRGIVARIDTATLQVEATCEVGYQPEQMARLGHTLYVANSGGYRPPSYDRTISVIDIAAFSVTKTIDVAPNLHIVKAHGEKLYVSSRGNYSDTPSDIYIVNPQTATVEERLGIEADVFCFIGEELLTLRGGQTGKAILRYNPATRTTSDFITDGTLSDIQMPYGLAYDEATQRIYITDARDYVSPGRVMCYDATGKRLWEAQAGDIPAHFAFVANTTLSDGNKPNGGEKTYGLQRIFAYKPAPGQFVNLLPEYTLGDDAAAMCAKVFQAIGEGRTGLVTLGGAGGYLVAGFGRRVENIAGEYDIEVLGNAFENASEPGIVSVMRDDNSNGLPDDTWYELAGSEQAEAIRDFTLTYIRPADDHTPESNGMPWCADAQYIAWHDGNGKHGYLAQNIYHRQPYYPSWVADEQLQFTFTLLPDHAYQSGETWLQPAFAWGYADNLPNGTDGCRFNIDWAVDKDGNHVHLSGIDFIRIHTAVFRQMEAVGEASTEVSGVRALHQTP